MNRDSGTSTEKVQKLIEKLKRRARALFSMEAREAQKMVQMGKEIEQSGPLKSY